MVSLQSFTMSRYSNRLQLDEINSFYNVVALRNGFDYRNCVRDANVNGSVKPPLMC